MQSESAHAERVVEALIRSGHLPVEWDGTVVHTQLRHWRLPRCRLSCPH